MKNKTVSTIFLIIFLFSCTGNFNKQSAVNLMDEYFTKVKERNLEILLDFYSDSFYDRSSTEEWLAMLENIHQKFGDFETSELSSWKIKNTVSISGSGTYFIFQYKSEYSNYSVIENLTLFKNKDSDEIKIVGHHFESEAFLTGQ